MDTRVAGAGDGDEATLPWSCAMFKKGAGWCANRLTYSSLAGGGGAMASLARFLRFPPAPPLAK